MKNQPGTMKNHVPHTYMFYVELAPLGGILGPLKSDLGLFLPFWATYFIRQKIFFCKKGHFP